MRTLALLLLASACSPAVCPEPAAVAGTWDVFAVVLTSVGGDDPDFPSYHSPANGASTWTLAWGEQDVGPVDMTVDGTPITAEGVWDRETCGTFSLDLVGAVTGPTGSEHGFTADALLMVYDDTLQGTWDWSESWTSRDDEATGTFSATGRVEGTRTGP